MNERSQPQPVGALTSATAGLGGIIWGYDYLTTDTTGTAFDRALVGGATIWGVIILVAGTITITALALTATKWRRPATIALIASHAAAFCVWFAICAALTALALEYHTGERFAYAALVGAGMNAIRVITLPAELIPPVTWDTIRRRARHRDNR